MKTKVVKFITFFLIMSECILANAQYKKENQEQGRFLVRCYIMAKTVMNLDKEATASEKAKINRWAQNAQDAATRLIPEADFLSVIDTETKKIFNTQGYLKAQFISCTTTLGSW